MYRKIFSCLLSICLCLSLASGALAADGMLPCVFDGFVVEYPEHLELREQENGLFFLDEDGFIQINTHQFPDNFSTPVSEWPEKGIVDYLKQTSIEEFTYTSDGELLNIGNLEFVFLQAQKGDSPFYQYFIMIDHMLILFTVKGDTCNAMMPDVLSSLRRAEAEDLVQKQNTGDPKYIRITRTNDKPVSYAEFREGFFDMLLDITGKSGPDDLPISRCFFSDGRYVRVLWYGYVVVRFFTSGPDETDILTEVSFSADSSVLSDEQMSTAAAALLLACYSGIGATHTETVDRFANLIHTGFPEDSGETPFWSEKAFNVFLGKNQQEYFGRIICLWETKQQEQASSIVQDILSDPLPDLKRPDLTVEKYIQRHNLMCQMLINSSGLGIVPQPVTQTEDGMTVLSCLAAGRTLHLKLYLKDQGNSSSVIRVKLECNPNAPDIMEVECLAAMYATMDVNDDEMISIMSLADTKINLWESLCRMKPYVSVNGVTLQAVETEDQLIAMVYGDGE